MQQKNRDICENIFIPRVKKFRKTDRIYNNKELGQKINQFCIPFSRSDHLCDVGESSVKEQFNALTSFLDMSAIYGSEKDVSIPLRTKENRLRKRGSVWKNLGTLAENKEQWNLPTRLDKIIVFTLLNSILILVGVE